VGEVLRLILLILLGGGAVTLAAWLYAYFMSEERRLGRAFRHGLGGAPDGALVALGSGRGVAMSLAAQRIVTVWDTGGWRLDYPLDALLGVELDVEGQIAARAMRGEPRRLLDRQSGAEREVRLRFLFDDARHPDFELVLWPCSAPRGGPVRPREAIAEGNRWIARVETVLRKTGGALRLAEPAATTAQPAVRGRREAPDLFDADEAEDEGPPWDEDEDEAEDADELAE
jgi:hypothetical protein